MGRIVQKPLSLVREHAEVKQQQRFHERLHRLFNFTEKASRVAAGGTILAAAFMPELMALLFPFALGCAVSHDFAGEHGGKSAILEMRLNQLNKVAGQPDYDLNQ